MVLLTKHFATISCLLSCLWNSHGGYSFASAFTVAPRPSALRYLPRVDQSTISRCRPSFTTTIPSEYHLRSRRGGAGVVAKASPSGIDAWPELAQAAVFFGVYASLGLATIPTTKALDTISQSIGLERWRNAVIDTTLPLALGAVFLSAGVGHFVAADAFADIYPPRGTWGIWYLPGSAEFHVAWTGAVEFLGGSGLAFGGLSRLFEMVRGEDDNDKELWVGLITPGSALMLCLLTVAVTPANIYMFTHGATMGDMGPLDLSFHSLRFGVQVLFLSMLIILAKDSFFFAWGDELD